MERLVQAVRAAPPRLILALGWLVLVIYAYPGRMTDESFEYLRQARTKFYAPENPPAVAWLWRQLELVVAGPSGMFFLTTVTFVAGTFWILRRVMTPSTAAWVTCAVIAFPPVLVPLGVIWSHSAMAGLLMIGIAALLDERARVQYAGLGALLLATIVQPTAALATLPPILLLFRRGPLLAGGTWLAITAVAFGFEVFFAKRALHLADWLRQVGDPTEIVPLRELTDGALKYGVATRTTGVQDAFTSVLDALSHTPLFWPVVYLPLAIAVVVLGRKQRDVLALVGSGLAFELTLIATATGLEYRQSHWMIATACVGAIIVAARRRA